MTTFRTNIPENIAVFYQDLDGRANRSAIFKYYRDIDESHLWPIRNDFNLTQRAINRLYKFESMGGYYLTGLELCLWLDAEMGTIVNSI